MQGPLRFALTTHDIPVATKLSIDLALVAARTDYATSLDQIRCLMDIQRDAQASAAEKAAAEFQCQQIHRALLTRQQENEAALKLLTP